MATGTISRVVYMGINLTNFIISFYPSFFKMDVQLEFDIEGKWGVDGINLLISIVILHIFRDYFHIITLNIVPATVGNIKYFLLFINRMLGPYHEILSPRFLKYEPSLRGPCIKNEGLVFHGMA